MVNRDKNHRPFVCDKSCKCQERHSAFKAIGAGRSQSFAEQIYDLKNVTGFGCGSIYGPTPPDSNNGSYINFSWGLGL